VEWFPDGGFSDAFIGAGSVNRATLGQADFDWDRRMVVRTNLNQVVGWRNGHWDPIAALPPECESNIIGGRQAPPTLVLLAQDEANTCIVSMLPDGGAEAKKVLFSPEPPPRMQAALAEIPGGVDLVLHGAGATPDCSMTPGSCKTGLAGARCRRSSGLGTRPHPVRKRQVVVGRWKHRCGPLNSLWLFSNRSWSPMAGAPVFGAGTRATALPDGGCWWRANRNVALGRSQWADAGTGAPFSGFRLATMPQAVEPSCSRATDDAGSASQALCENCHQPAIGAFHSMHLGQPRRLRMRLFGRT